MPAPCHVAGNSLTLLTKGPERLDALVGLIDGAMSSLKLLYYIYADDAEGARVRAALIAASGRGVAVALIVDAFGSDTSEHEDFFAPLTEAGIDVCKFHPRLGRRYLLRNHQKLALADDARVIVGGFNLAHDYFAASGSTAWRDLGLLVEGEAAARLSGYFDALKAWTQLPKARIRDLRAALFKWSSHEGKMRWLLGGPALRLSPWVRRFRADMRAARKIDMIAGYFAPNPAMLRRLNRVASRRHVRVVTASKTDNPATIGAARFTYAFMLKKNVQVFEYQPSRLHTKLFVIDDIVHIGSANFDMRSLYLNLEIMLRIEDKAFAAQCRAYIDGEIANSVKMKLEDFRGMGTWAAKARWAFCYFIVAIADYRLSRRLNVGVD